ncbi:MAG TPA: hypothetical protein ENK18_20540 [Deltaproteobacteria bacterium]|nr:hypothetical protein [Deltaproteobacteria bacterium]
MSMWVALYLPHAWSAWAFAPTQAPHETLSLEPQRIQTLNPGVQARLLRSEAWRRFVELEGDRWEILFDEHTSTPRVLWGGGVAMPTGGGAALAGAVRAWLDRHAELLGYEPGALALASSAYAPESDMWYLDFDVIREGLPTYRGQIRARIKHGNLILVHVATAPGADVTGAYVWTAEAAIEAAIARGPAPDAEHTAIGAEPILLDHKHLGAHELRRTWMVRSQTRWPPGRWVSFVDAESGELLSVHNEVRFASGQILGEHHARTVDGSPLITSPMPYVRASVPGDSDYADVDGNYTVNDASTYSTRLDDGLHIQVLDDSGAEGFLNSANPDMTWDSSDATQAEIDTYLFAHQARAWGEVVAPTVAQVTQYLTAHVNIGGPGNVCNAYWNGEINFFQAGGGCNNTGQIADVVYHEWGHGFHYYSIVSGYFDSSLSEGAADTVSFLITGDPEIGPYFQTNGTPVRDVAPDKIYPQDYVNNPYYVHSNGLIFGGAVWDLRGLLQDIEGVGTGQASTERIFTGLLRGGTDIPGTFYEALAADDDDGNLDNGTPHICEIHEAFGRHGLGPGGASDTTVLVNHEPLTSVPAGQDHAIEVELIELQDGCRDGDASAADVHWRVDGGPWQSAALLANGPDISGAIPEQPLGSIIEYYIAGETVDGDDFATPEAGEIAPYSFIVGDVIEIGCEDFEADDGGFEHLLVSGDPGDGADDWQWGLPNGLSGDPSSAYSGTHVWGNDLGQYGFNGAYQPDKVNRLTSVPIGTSHYTDVFLQYRRWLQVEDGIYDQAVILANDQEVWSNREGAGDESHVDRSWVHHVVGLDGLGDRGEISIAWELRTDPGLELGGWTIDDVCIMAPATADNRLGIVDFEVDDLEDTLVALSWTNPEHRPVARVIVVRRFNDYPDGWDDGDIVYDESSPEPGERIEIEDRNYHSGDSFYAVYAFDGAEWLSWTVEGWNADEIDLVGGEPPPGWPTDTDGDGLIDELDAEEAGGGKDGGCGCSGTGGAPVGLALLVGVALVRRRRS